MAWNNGFHSAAAASEFTFTFTAPGLFHYICEPHVGVGMRGTVTVTAETVEVGTVDLTFVPPDVVIKVGDSVHWTGLSGGFHTVAEVDDALAVAWNNGFHSAAAASEFSFTFTAPGLFHYICEPHVGVGMRGTVRVRAIPIPTVSTWGMAVLVLAVLTAGTIVFGIRRRAARVTA